MTYVKMHTLWKSVALCTKVQKLVDQPVRYLDGDIWLAVKSDSRERFVTAFVDITNEAEREEEMLRLREDARGSRVIVAYDRLQSIGQLIEENDV